MSHQYIYVMKDLTKSYNGNKEVLKNIWLSFLPGAKIGIIGHNGSGKSTLLKIMAGLDQDFSGEAWAAKGTKIGYLPQEPKLNHNKNVFDNIIEAVADKKQLLDQFELISNSFSDQLSEDQMNSLLEQQGELQQKIEDADAWELDRQIEIAMNALNCPSKDSEINSLSGGEKRRVALCKLLLQQPQMLLLDEPTNHLDAQSVAWLERYLKEYNGTVVMITHDRYFLDNVTSWILELDRACAMPWEGNYSSWLAQKEEKLRNEEKGETSRQKQLAKELDWVRQSPKARQAKSKARLNSYYQAVNEQKEQNQDQAQIIIPNGPRLGQLVIEATELTKNYQNRQLINNFSFNIPPGAVVGVIGPNGAGKTSLFKLLTGHTTAEYGDIKIGETVKLGYIDQSRDSLDNQKTVWEEISDGLDELLLGKLMIKSRAYCAAFNFKGTDQQKLVGKLSGGERNRVHLAKMLKEGANVLLLDEPTNDLDVDTLRALEEAILSFSGCVIVISHDRWFLDRIATHIIAFEENEIQYFEGNYAQYEEYRFNKLGLGPINSNKIKYRKINA